MAPAQFPRAILLVVLFVAWLSQVYYLWPTPLFVAKETVELLGNTHIWVHFVKWIALIGFGLLATFALYKEHRLWPIAVLISSVLYLWFIEFPRYFLPFFQDVESLDQLSRRMHLLGEALSSLVLLHLQFVLPLIYLIGAIYSAVYLARTGLSNVGAKSNGGI